MKKHGILNSEIARVLAGMGHTDTLCIGDCGLPIPPGVERIDISLKHGVPGFVETVEAVAADMVVEAVTLASEIKEHNPEVEEALKKLFPEAAFHYSSHVQFKLMTKNCKAVVRTGEVTPYANVILHSGVYFG